MIIMLLLISLKVFGQETPLYEVSGGFISSSKSGSVNIKFIYPITEWGFNLDIGAVIGNKPTLNIFAGPFYYFDFERVRIPITFGASFQDEGLGIGGGGSIHYKFEHIYIGINLMMTYRFYKRIKISTIEKKKIGYTDSGEDVFNDVPGSYNQYRFTNRISFNPSILIGYQY